MDKRDDPREAAERLDTPDRAEAGPEAILSAVADEAHDEMGATVDGQPLDFGMDPRTDSRGPKRERNNDYNWARSTDVGPDRRFGETLAQQERRLGREAEQERHSAVARAAAKADIDRAASSRVQCQEMDTEYQRTTPESVERDTVADDFEAGDPRARMDRDDLATVNQSAAQLAEHFGAEISMDRPALARLLAKLVDQGQDVMSAVTSTRERLESIAGVAEPVSKVDPWQYKTTVEGEIELFEHPKPNQYQSGFIQGEDGTRLKFVYWNNSKKCNGMPTLRQGDRVRFEEIKVSEYQGQASLAIDNGTDITILEHGDGPMYMHGQQSDQARVAPWDTESDQHAWANRTDVEPADQEEATVEWSGLGPMADSEPEREG